MRAGVRLTTAVGEVRDSAAAQVGWAEVSLREERGPSQPPILNVGLRATSTGGPFPLPVAGARLLGTGGAVLAAVPFAAGGGSAFGFATLADSGQTSVLRSLLLAGSGQLDVTTGDQPARRLSVALRLREARNWERVICE